MGLFASVGTQLAWDSGLPALVATLLGVITAVFGGVLRDVVCNEIPVAFSDHRPYALCAFIGGWTLLGAQAIDVPAWLCLLCGTACASGLRTAAIVTGYTLPTWRTE
ncbi:TRIC cation channel family protein [Aquincola sp. J276]|uniref:trimeric intracellular cation channel family protein n=1 Tax=Aquincola sp. J276 TaxID=2898432 RepID=UPI002873D91F|nr:TRIC cation channel family protein [Aquincola sp. J276]